MISEQNRTEVGLFYFVALKKTQKVLNKKSAIGSCCEGTIGLQVKQQPIDN